jgi:hypothetical protein
MSASSSESPKAKERDAARPKSRDSPEACKDIGPKKKIACTLGFRAMTKLDEQAAELGFKIKKGPTKFSGYILINLTHDDLDEHPLGDDFRASLSDIEDYLESYAADIAAGRVKAATDDDDEVEAEVETGIKRPKVKPPAPATISKALRGHEHAAEIKAMAKSAKVSVPQTTDLQFELRALKSREEFKPNWNNVGGLHDFNEHDEEDDSYLRQFLEHEKRKRQIFEKHFAPDKATPDYTAPTPPVAAAKVVSITRRFNPKKLLAESQAKAAAREAELESELKKARDRVRAKNKALQKFT